ncbi:hypothetical protein BJ912DRAFT_1030927 [Pholiota molesta]|nr:hypothetical protein BJ912DRAFT_1030927 [Pholiota molesta]
MWDPIGKFFTKISLASLGYRYQLGHAIGGTCPNPEPAYAGKFTVLDINGIHDVNLDFCGCVTQQLHYLQILRFGWFPATVGIPRTAVTFRLLKFFQMLSFESKSTAFEFHQTLQRLSDNTGTVPIKDRYRVLLRVIREYRHLKMLKRAGRGHSPTGAEGTSAGECAVLCPACPQPGKNLPEGWQDAPPEKRHAYYISEFLYRLFIGLDANFRLKRRMVSSQASDPSLSNGWSYFVEEVDYKAFLRSFGTLVIQEPRPWLKRVCCVGAGTCDCTRHDMKRPCSVGDLQKGERYVNMDYLFFSSFKNLELVEVTVSYDIACQWSIHLWERMNSYPSWMHVDHMNRTTYQFLIPKFHLPAHTRPCQTKFSFNFNKNVGRTDGEGVERGWARINPLAPSTREMGPGSRRDTLDDHFGDQNWYKTTKMATHILTGIKEAVAEAADRTSSHAEFTNGVGKDDVDEWTRQLDTWEADHSAFNPLEGKFKGLMQKSVKLRLAEQEETEIIKGNALILHEEITAIRLITLGLEYEIQQERLLEELNAMTAHSTAEGKAKWQFKSNTLRRKIITWIEAQQMYIPGLYLIRLRANNTNDEGQEETPVYEIPLMMPSSIFHLTSCDIRLMQFEWDFRYAQSVDSLDDLRDILIMRAYVLIDKRRFQRGQRANTRSQGLVDRIQTELRRAATRYRKARAAIELLAKPLGKIAWDKDLLPLKDEDIQSLSPDDQEASEGHRTVSWIWMHAVGDGERSADDRLHESLRIEWCKSRARRDRWVEEVQLIQEERRRILEFLDYRANEWLQRAQGDHSWMLPGVQLDQIAINGRLAYARRQASQFQSMRSYFDHATQNVDVYIASHGDGSVSLTGAKGLASLQAEELEDDDMPGQMDYSLEGQFTEDMIAS